MAQNRKIINTLGEQYNVVYLYIIASIRVKEK